MLLAGLYARFKKNVRYSFLFLLTIEPKCINVRYHSGGSMKINACILILAHMVYL